ncbi:MAG: intermembrane transport protein PqiB [Steroidobacteraceae bacterium]
MTAGGERPGGEGARQPPDPGVHERRRVTSGESPGGDSPGGESPGGGPPLEHAALRTHSWLSWMWLVPVIAAAIVLWLAWRSLEARGPEITIAFADAGTITPGQTPIKYKGVTVGVVRSVSLAPNISQVLVHARMSRTIEPYLASGARFWIVQPHVGAQGISGLSTLVSGAYIEMYPGRGAAERRFRGLAEPPILQPDTAGTLYTLLAPDVSSLIPGAPITFRGLDVGEIEGFSLAPKDREAKIYAFVRAPYDQLVHASTRFWNVAGIDLVASSGGVQLRVNSWQQLLAGGVAFDNPERAAGGSPIPRGTTFELYDSRGQAFRYPHGKPLLYRVAFAADASGLGKGTPVALEGTEIGEVTQTRLTYDRQRRALYTLATLALDSSDLDIPGIKDPASAKQAAAVRTALAELVARGLRARLVTSNLLTGSKLIALDVVADAPPGRIRQVDGFSELPTAPAADIEAILRSVQSTMHHIDRATAGPHLAHALAELDATLTHLDTLSSQLAPETKSLIASLRATSAAAQRAAQAANAVLGANSTRSTDLPRLMRQLSDAARSVRDLADYLDRHPEALLRGRQK